MNSDIITPPPPEQPEGTQNQETRPRNALSQGMLPAPTHQQTVVLMRHMQELQRELKTLLQDPDCGRADMRSAIIDAMTRGVSERLIAAPDAVDQLASVPNSPFGQKQWLEKHLEQTIAAEISVLDHHRATHAPIFPDFATEHAVQMARDNRTSKANDIEIVKGAYETHYNKRKMH